MSNNTTIEIAGYQILSQIYESANSLVYRGKREQDDRTVILKVLKEDYPTPQELTRYKQEYEIIRNLNLDGVVKAHDLQRDRKTLVIILEDFGASSLKELLNYSAKAIHRLPLPQFLKIAIKIADILGRIHSSNVIHKDINPANIIFNSDTEQLKIIDFGISTQLDRENPTLKNPNVLEGTLAYMSPEQTGRMNRALDYRTDFYSLGVTLYELLTGKLPFETTDALELVHCHIAKQPVCPHKIDADIPQAVSDIVMKLMAKTAEERYQSAWGIKADLEECLHQLQVNGEISQFPLGTRDISDKFQIPQKLYGREAEVETLLAAFERVAGGSKIELMLVAGYSGIGKSALVAEVHKPITEKRGYFISGKFEQFQRNIPYSAVVEAFKGLMRQLLTESASQLTQWREKLLAAVGSNGQVIIDVIPEVELIVGKQPPAPELGATESQNRFNLVFSQFIRAFCTKEHPLVIFLDDLQWADSATLKLLELIITDSKTRYLFLIGAYRDNEVSPTHPLMMTIEGLQKQGAMINCITLAPLAVEHISLLLADTLHSNLDSVSQLAELVKQKTGGNPFFANQFLKTLYSENLIKFHLPQSPHSQGGFWQWDIANIEAQDITDNVVELTIARVKKLPESTQQILQLAACIGASFDLNTLAAIGEKSRVEISQALTPAIQLGLILPTSELDAELLIRGYKFLHDRVQQAAYALIENERKQAVHHQIGRLFLNHVSAQSLPEKIFEIVDHLNWGWDAIADESERVELARLNLEAGKKAKDATAYQAALGYLTGAIEHVGADCWESQYDLMLALHHEALEAMYLNGNFEQLNTLTEVVLQEAKILLDRVKVYEVKIQAFVSQGNLKAAIQTGLAILELLEVVLPKEPTPTDIQKGLATTASLLAGKPVEDLVNLPLMTDPAKLAAMRILSSIIAASYLAAPQLLLLITLAMVNLSLQYGNASVSAFGYSMYGLILCGLVGDIDSGYQLGRLALNLVSKLNATEIKARTAFIVYTFIQHWKEHISKTAKPLQLTYSSGVETGDLEYAGFALYLSCVHGYFSSQELTQLALDMATYRDAFSKIKHEIALHYHEIYWQAVLNLMGQSEHPCYLIGEAYNEQTMLPFHQSVNDKTGLNYFYLNKLILCYLFESYQEAIANAVQAERYLDAVQALVVVPFFHFYDSLARLALYPDALQSDSVAGGNLQPKTILEKVVANQEKIQQWGHYAPMNHLHKFYLVEAEKARVLGQILEAEEFYEKAITGARENDYLQEEALAYELAAKFYLGRGREKIAQTYMKEAHYAYMRWGAKAKVEDLEAKYSQLLPNASVTNSVAYISTTTTNSTRNSQSGEALDLATVMKASQAISGEIMLDKLLANLMKILIENTGAQTGFLILDKAGEWVIEASGNVDCDRIAVLESIPIHQNLPLSIVNYVIRTRETVVKTDAVNQGKFTNDPYIKANQTKSILCAPLLDRGQLSGIVYLENNLTSGVFTPDRLEVIKLLSGQAAIAIDNARLYNNLEQKVAERTQELAQALEELKTTQDELIQKEKMAALGQLIAGIAHEINTPLGAIRSSAGNIAKFLDQTLEQLPILLQSLSKEDSARFMALLQRSLQQSITFSTKEERQFKRALRRQMENSEIDNADVIAERLVIMGITNEIDPFVPLLKRPDSFQILEIAYKLSELKRGTTTINTSTDRASKVVFALKTYARYDQSGEMILSHLKEGIDTVLALYQNQLKQGVKVLKNYAEIPPIPCYPDELNQVWTNLIHNALQAMDNRGTLAIDIAQVNRQVRISFTDSGCGIPEEIQAKIFEPFFTTKPAGEGSGLGLDIVKKIINKHSGNITVESQPGRTTFHVFLPIQPDEE